MMRIGALKLDPAEFASQGSAVLGIRDSGKTYTATLIAERMIEAGIPIIAFDPIGVWRFLRIPGKGKGYPVVVAGGEDGDLPLTPGNAPEIVEAAMANGVSLVIDLFDIKLSKADWKRIVRDCVTLLLHKNKSHGLRHIFLEEAAEFAPQKVGPSQGEVYAAVEKLARMGGNSRLGYTLINQRSQEVNKAVLELCDNLFLHRQRGLNSLANLKKWLDVAGAESGEIMAALPTLPQGECYAWIAASDTPTHLKVPAKNSLHPDRRVMRDKATEDEAKRKSVNVDSFLEKLKGQLEKTEADRAANDPVLLRRELAAEKAKVARLERELSKKPVDTAGMETALAAAKEAAQARGVSIGFDRAIEALKAAKKGAAMPAPVISATGLSPADRREIAAAKPGRIVPARAAPAPTRSNGASSLPPGETAVLIAAVQYGGVDRDQLSVLTGYKRSSRDAYILRLKNAGLVTVQGQTVVPTDGARDALGDAYQPLPTGKDLQDYWMGKLPTGEAAVLQCLIDAFPSPVERPEIDLATGYKRSSRDAYIQRLKARRLLDASGSSVRAAATLF
jgi:uncharacterized protein